VALLDHAIVRLLPAIPKSVVRRVSGRYIAGEQLEDALRVVRRLNAEGKLATIDVLGEEIANPDEAREIARAYRGVFGALAREGLDSNVSVKLTALGLKLGYELCRAHLEDVVEHAAERGNFVRIDMEDSSTTDDTLRLYRELRAAGHDNVGIVLQSRLKRTLDDVDSLADLRPNVRLCKGIYLEPPAIAFQDFEAVRGAFAQALDRARSGVAERRLGSDGYELQMLLGVLPGLADELVREGHRLRIYTPFGSHWYGYALRRLQENPKIAGYIASDTLHRLLPGRNGSR
jgi:proline dehydrogenase